MNDPSQGIHRDLLPHIHLISTYRFPQLPQIHPDKVSEWLQAAPKITRDQAPFYWTYLDRPQDMTILLVWQSLALGVEFPSDGYIWTPQETALQFQVEGGYTLEMYHQKVGYSPGNSIATHTRRRFRLLPPRIPGPQSFQPDPNLWIVHYGAVEPSERIPSSLIPIDIRVQQIMSARQYLHSQGQIVQKEFMLHDRSNWPTIAFPRNRPQAPSMYGQNLPATRIPQAMAYPTQNPVAGPPNKKIRTQPNTIQSTPTNIVPVFDVDEEEDNSRGDVFDHITPREISMSRYKQNHEWMEEIISSPYSINRIIPTDLGLGVCGELAGLTCGIFDAPLDPDKDVSKHYYVGRLDPEKAEEFKKRVNQQIAQFKGEIEDMKVRHEKRLAHGKKASLFSLAEKRLRLAVADPLNIGPEFWRLEGRIEENESGEVKAPACSTPKVSDIIAQVEASVGRHATAVKELIRIQDGGFEETIPIASLQAAACPSSHIPPSLPQEGSLLSAILNNTVDNNEDVEMNNSVASLLDYQTGNSSKFSTGPIRNFYTTQSNTSAYSNTVTTGNQQAQYNAQKSTHQGEDQSLRTDNSHVGDWPVIPPRAISMNENQNLLSSAQSILQSSSGLTHSVKTANYSNFGSSTSSFPSLSHLVTAGDTSTSYVESEGLGDLNLQMELDVRGELEVLEQNSAFSDAFHGHNVTDESTDIRQDQ